jgi:RimJ/RimL family protein N-acetyltransferase
MLDDATAAGELLSDPAVMRFLGGSVVPREHHGAVIEKWLRRWEEDLVGPFVIERRSDGRFLGRSGILIWDSRSWTHTTITEARSFAQPELGWALVRAAWGNGYATEAARAVRDWARRDRNITRLISLIAPDNIASQRVAERLDAVPTDTVTLSDSLRNFTRWRIRKQRSTSAHSRPGRTPTPTTTRRSPPSTSSGRDPSSSRR